LRHLARTRLLLHLIDMAPLDDSANPVKDAKAIVKELRKYDEALYQKPRWLVLNKSDMLESDVREQTTRRILKGLGWKGKTFIISALTGTGCSELSYAIMEHLEQRARADASPDGSDAGSLPVRKPRAAAKRARAKKVAA
jgi:GTP-binding protein